MFVVFAAGARTVKMFHFARLWYLKKASELDNFPFPFPSFELFSLPLPPPFLRLPPRPPPQNFKTRRFSHLEECHVLFAVLLFIFSFLCHSYNSSSSFESFLAISVAWDQASHWGKKEKNGPRFCLFPPLRSLVPSYHFICLKCRLSKFYRQCVSRASGKDRRFLR